jgi:protein O-mannosyl-transferase
MATPNWKPQPLPALLIIAAGFWVFLPALGGDWLWDDSRLITGNYYLRTVPGLEQIWFAAPMTDYWPLTWTLLWTEWHLWGGLTFGYHVCTLALHLLSGFLVWRLFGRLGLRWAWFGGLIFVIHPVAVESVAWLSEIKNTLSLPFFLLSLNAYMDDDESGKGYLRSVLYYLVAMLCKTSVIMLPAVLLLYCWWKHGRMARLDLRKIIPFFCIALVLGTLAFYLQIEQSAEASLSEPGIFSRLIGAGVALFFYLGKFLAPTTLMPVYHRWTFAPPSLLQLSTLPLLAIFFWALWKQRQGWGRHALLGLGFFVLTVLPALGLFKMSYLHVSPVADHLIYLPMIGLIGLAVAGLETLWRRLSLRYRQALPVAAGAWALLLAWQAHGYARNFSSGEKLWTYTLRLNPGAATAHDNLGLVLLQSGRVEQAQEQFEIALQIDPFDSTAHNNLGVTLLQTQHYPEMIQECEAALRVNPHYAEAHDNIGLALAQMGQLTEAIKHEQAAVKINPEDVDAHVHLGNFLLQAGQSAAAAEQYGNALRIDPDEAKPDPIKH